MKLTYKHTLIACFGGYIVQAILINFLPLLFVTFQNEYHLPLDQITLLVTANFIVQLATDLVCSKWVDKLGHRRAFLIAHAAAALGLAGLSFLPQLLPPFPGLLLCVCTYAIGGGIIEVLVSPITESCPTENKEKAMSLLHSFYCWGLGGVVLLSTLFFRLAGIQNWRILAIIWALVPVCNGILFSRVPMPTLVTSGKDGMTLGALFGSKTFWLLLIMMLCAGAAENGVILWASAFAEEGLGIDKTLGDLAGPMAFALLMGIVRAIHSKHGEKMDLHKLMVASTVLCVISYLLASVFSSPIINLIGCALCGVAVACMWPGTLSKAAAALPTGGTAMFALLAVSGDLGCAAGPTLVGMVSDAAGDNMKLGILAGIVFPAALLVALLLQKPNKH